MQHREIHFVQDWMLCLIFNALGGWKPISGAKSKCFDWKNLIDKITSDIQVINMMGTLSGQRVTQTYYWSPNMKSPTNYRWKDHYNAKFAINLVLLTASLEPTDD